VLHINKYFAVGLVVSTVELYTTSRYSAVPMCPGVESASRNEYQDIPGGKDGRCVRVTTLPPSCAECLEVLEP
jgi:hypothetical protein